MPDTNIPPPPFQVATPRETDLAAAADRAHRVASHHMAAHRKMPVGIAISELIKHGGLYTLLDKPMMQARLAAMQAAAPAGSPAIDATALAEVPAAFFYKLAEPAYALPSSLVSYLSHPARHLRGPIVGGPPTPAPDGSAPPYAAPGVTYDQSNAASPDLAPSVTFLGQFIDHDLTLNAMNLFDNQTGDLVNHASPLIDLDCIYGPRIDDAGTGLRPVPMTGGFFNLTPIPSAPVPGGVGYDVCRDPATQKALIGDKRNDENQLVLQVHILAMRLHNHFMKKDGDEHAAQRHAILSWQAMVATDYLTQVCRRGAVVEVMKRLLSDPSSLCHRPGLTSAGGTILGMPHEFGIGFRFGHSQLRSEYKLTAAGQPIRLFDSLAAPVPAHDLQGSKKLAADHVIDWHHFADPAQARSNLIDTKLNEVTFDLPQGAIPDDLKLVANLGFRNLVRSNSIGLCAGEDLAAVYQAHYPGLLSGAFAPPGPGQIEPNAEYQPIYQLAPAGQFRTPMFYYLLREAELNRTSAGETGNGTLGMLGSLLVAEVILSGIFYASQSILKEPVWLAKINPWLEASAPAPILSFLDIVALVEASNVAPPSC